MRVRPVLETECESFAELDYIDDEFAGARENGHAGQPADRVAAEGHRNFASRGVRVRGRSDDESGYQYSQLVSVQAVKGTRVAPIQHQVQGAAGVSLLGVRAVEARHEGARARGAGGGGGGDVEFTLTAK